MLQRFCHFVFFKLFGWKEIVTVPPRSKSVLCVAPHTSNFDFIWGEMYYTAKGRKANFLMKKDWFFEPLGTFFRAIGGIPVNRSKKNSLTDQLAEMALQSDYFNLAVTPEGTRSLATTWKRGFYYIAQKANLPIQLYAIDYQRRTIVCTKEIFPSGNIEEDMREIMAYYRQFSDGGRHTEKFVTETL